METEPLNRKITKEEFDKFWNCGTQEARSFATPRFGDLTFGEINLEENNEHRNYLINHLPLTNISFKLSPYSDKDLETYVPEKQAWLIESQIPKGEIGLLVGKRGEFKTWVALDEAINLAAGTETFGDIVPEPKKVLFIDEESGKNQISIRRNLLKNGLGLKQPLNIKFLSFEGLKLDRLDTEKFEQFKQLLEDFKPDLVVVDCLARVVSFEIDKDNASINELFTGVIRPFIKQYGMTWLFLHHLRKSPQGNIRVDDNLDEVRGGSELVNYCRFVLMCQTPKFQNKNEDGSKMIVLKFLKMSNSELPEPKVLSFIPDKPEGTTSIKINYLGKCEDVLATEVRVGNAILEYLFNKQITGEFKTKDIEEAAEEIGFKRSNLSMGLKSLLDRNKIIKIKRGVYEVAAGIKKDKQQKTLDIPKKKEPEQQDNLDVSEQEEEDVI